jgi:hypothetical protein
MREQFGKPRSSRSIDEVQTRAFARAQRQVQISRTIGHDGAIAAVMVEAAVDPGVRPRDAQKTADMGRSSRVARVRCHTRHRIRRPKGVRAGPTMGRKSSRKPAERISGCRVAERQRATSTCPSGGPRYAPRRRARGLPRGHLASLWYDPCSHWAREGQWHRAARRCRWPATRGRNCA